MKFARFRYNYRYSVHWNKPQLIWRIVKAYFKILLFRRQPLRYIDVNVGLACNLSCTHCFAEDFKSTGSKELSNDEWKDVIKQCMKLGNIAIGFTGGEPLVYKRLFELIACSYPKKNLILVCTNGVLLTPEMARRLKAAHVDIVQMSLDSGDEETHDQFRAQDGAYAKTLKAFDIAREAGLKVAVVPTVSHLNLRTKGFTDLLDWAEREDILVNLSMAAPVGEWAGNNDCLLTEEDVAMINGIVEKRPNIRRDFETNYWTQGCGAATEKLYFTPYGDVIPCPYMHISFGNVRDVPVTTIRQKMLDNRFLEGFNPKCLTAEHTEFIDNYLPKVLLKDKPLPTSEEVFDASLS